MGIHVLRNVVPRTTFARSPHLKVVCHRHRHRMGEKVKLIEREHERDSER
jgi:hypothetical protein